MHRASTLYAQSPRPLDESALIQRYSTLIDRCARRLAGRSGGAVAADDLWSAGALGLIEAARRFDEGRDVRFESFAEHRIRGAMLDELRRLDFLPRRLRGNVEGLQKARNRLSHELGREPESEELASALGMEMEQLANLEALERSPLPIHEEMPLASAEASVESRMAREQERNMVAEAISKLPPRLMTLLSLYYVEGLTLKEISLALEVSEPRVCQLHKDALAKLRLVLDGQDIGEM